MRNCLKNNIGLFILLGLVLTFSGCKDIFEEDITNKKISIISPLDGAQNKVYKQLFWWTKLDGASQYAIQIVSPSFDSIKYVFVDTVLIDQDKFTKTLVPGKYQWRIRGENGGYKTNYQQYNLTILQANLNEQTVSLIAPANNLYYGPSSDGIVKFSWEAISGATNYVIEIDTVSGNFGSTVILLDSTSASNYTYTFPAQGSFKWRVKAKDNAGLETQWSSVYTVGYISKLPVAPELSAPADNFNATSVTVKFDWDLVANAKTYTLHIYKSTDDINLDSPTKYTIAAPITEKTLTIPSAFKTGDDLFWKVSVTDKANQVSPLSVSRKVKVF